MSDSHTKLIGIWKMVSFDVEDKESGEEMGSGHDNGLI